MQSEYNAKVLAYLESIKVSAEITPDERQTCPERCESYIYRPSRPNHSEAHRVAHNHGHKYVLTLKRGIASGAQTLILDGFWNSIASRYNTLNINVELKPGAIAACPNVYDMMSCYMMSAFANHETFDEWCANLGYDTDSRKAERAYYEEVEKAIRIQRFFTREELDILQELAS